MKKMEVSKARQTLSDRPSHKVLIASILGWIYHQMLLDSWVLTSTALVRSKVVVASGGFDETLPFSEDWDFWLRAYTSLSIY